MVHEGKNCNLKNQQDGPSTIPDMAKTQINSTYQASSSSSNANTIQSFQAIFTKLLLEQKWLYGLAWLTWLFMIFFTSDTMAKAQPSKDTIFFIYALLLLPILLMLPVKALLWLNTTKGLHHWPAVPPKLHWFHSRLKPAKQIKTNKSHWWVRAQPSLQTRKCQANQTGPFSFLFT